MKNISRITAGIAAFVMAFSAIGFAPAESPFSAAVSVSAAEYNDSVSGFTYNAGSDRIELYWNDLESAYSYRVDVKNMAGEYKKASYKLSKTQDGKIKATITGLTCGKKYTFKVTPLKKTNSETVSGKAKTVSASTKISCFIPTPDMADKEFNYKPLSPDGEYCYTFSSNDTSHWSNYVEYLNKRGFTLNRTILKSEGMCFEVYYENSIVGLVYLFTDKKYIFVKDPSNPNPSCKTDRNAKYSGGSKSKIIAPTKVDSSFKKTYDGKLSTEYSTSKGRKGWSKYLNGLEDYGYLLWENGMSDSCNVFFNGYLVGIVTYSKSKSSVMILPLV